MFLEVIFPPMLRPLVHTPTPPYDTCTSQHLYTIMAACLDESFTVADRLNLLLRCVISIITDTFNTAFFVELLYIFVSYVMQVAHTEVHFLAEAVCTVNKDGAAPSAV